MVMVIGVFSDFSVFFFNLFFIVNKIMSNE